MTNRKKVSKISLYSETAIKGNTNNCLFKERNRQVQGFKGNIESHPFADSEISCPQCGVNAFSRDTAVPYNLGGTTVSKSSHKQYLLMGFFVSQFLLNYLEVIIL